MLCNVRDRFRQADPRRVHFLCRNYELDTLDITKTFLFIELELRQADCRRTRLVEMAWFLRVWLQRQCVRLQASRSFRKYMTSLKDIPFVSHA